MAQLLSDNAYTWWEIVRDKSTREELSWVEFRKEFKDKYYSQQHWRSKEQEFIGLQ